MNQIDMVHIFSQQPTNEANSYRITMSAKTFTASKNNFGGKTILKEQFGCEYAISGLEEQIKADQNTYA